MLLIFADMKETLLYYIKGSGHTIESFASDLRWSRMKLYRKLADPERITMGELFEIAEKLKVPVCNLFKAGI